MPDDAKKPDEAKGTVGAEDLAKTEAALKELDGLRSRVPQLEQELKATRAELESSRARPEESEPEESADQVSAIVKQVSDAAKAANWTPKQKASVLSQMFQKYGLTGEETAQDAITAQLKKVETEAEKKTRGIAERVDGMQAALLMRDFGDEVSRQTAELGLPKDLSRNIRDIAVTYWKNRAASDRDFSPEQAVTDTINQFSAFGKASTDRAAAKMKAEEEARKAPILGPVASSVPAALKEARDKFGKADFSNARSREKAINELMEAEGIDPNAPLSATADRLGIGHLFGAGA